MRVTHFVLYDSAVSGDGYSQAIDLQMISGFAVQAVNTGNLTANLILQVSTEQHPTNWIDLDTQATGGEPSTFLWNSSQASYRWLRIAISYGGGTGNLRAVLNCKGRK